MNSLGGGEMVDRPVREWDLKEAGPEGKALLDIVDRYERSR